MYHQNIYFNIKRLRVLFVLLTALSVLASCKKMVELDAPVTEPSSETVYNNKAEATAVLTSIYAQMSANTIGFTAGRGSIGISVGLAADEYTAYANISGNYWPLYTNALTAATPYAAWNELYKYIYIANSALEGINRSTQLEAATKKQLTGEAKFIRSFLYFYLVNLYGDVPLVMTTDYRANQLVSRSSVAQVYTQITADLEEARNLLSDDYLDAFLKPYTSGIERVRPTKSAATALLARVYLYKKEWANAEAMATEVIGDSKFSLLTDPGSIFLKNSNEAIWQLSPANTTYTFDGSVLLLTRAPYSSQPVSLSTSLLNSLETNDMRKTSWVDSITSSGNKYYYLKKYKVRTSSTTSPITEYIMALRLAEQYLIRAEARAQQNKLTGANSAESDINAIRTRAILPNTTASTQPELLAAIEQERRIELMGEWGHRWFDLKRTDRANAVMSVETPLKGGTWDTNWQLFPIPEDELLNAPNLTQNPGYN